MTDFVKVDDLAMTFEVRLKLIMSWNDPQLQVETFANNEKTRIIPPSTLSTNQDANSPESIPCFKTVFLSPLL